MELPSVTSVYPGKHIYKVISHPRYSVNGISHWSSFNAAFYHLSWGLLTAAKFKVSFQSSFSPFPFLFPLPPFSPLFPRSMGLWEERRVRWVQRMMMIFLSLLTQRHYNPIMWSCITEEKLNFRRVQLHSSWLLDFSLPPDKFPINATGFKFPCSLAVQKLDCSSPRNVLCILASYDPPATQN